MGLSGISLTTEPFLLFYVTGGMLHLPVCQQYVYSRFSQDYNFTFDFKNSKPCQSLKNVNSTREKLEKQVQFLTSSFQIGYTVCSILPSLIICLLLGPLSDHVGRKPVLILTTLGSCVESSIIVLVMYLNLSVWYVLAAAFLNGISGYTTGSMSATMSYIADTTEGKQRIIKMGYMEGIILCGAMLGSLISGHLIRQFGFTNAYWVVWALRFASLLYTAFILPESLPLQCRRHILHGCKNVCQYLGDIIKVFKRRNENRLIILTALLGTCVMHFIQLGMASVNILYLLNSPLCMSSTNVGYSIALRFFAIGFGSAIGIKLLSGIVSDSILLALGYSSNIVGMLILAFSKKEWMVYLGWASLIFLGFAIPIFRTTSSLYVPDVEQGSLFSIMAALEMLFVLAGTFTFNSFYSFANEVLDFAGAVYLLNACLTIIPMALSITLAVKSKRRQGYSSIDGKGNFHQTSEEKSIDNYHNYTTSV